MAVLAHQDDRRRGRAPTTRLAAAYKTPWRQPLGRGTVLDRWHRLPPRPPKRRRDWRVYLLRRSGKYLHLEVGTIGMRRGFARQWEAGRLEWHRRQNNGRNPRYNKTRSGS